MKVHFKKAGAPRRGFGYVILCTGRTVSGRFATATSWASDVTCEACRKSLARAARPSLRVPARGGWERLTPD
jgi:hypothetical protein